MSILKVDKAIILNDKKRQDDFANAKWEAEQKNNYSMSKEYFNKDRKKTLEECNINRKKHQIGSKFFKNSCFCKTKPIGGQSWELCAFFSEQVDTTEEEIKKESSKIAEIEKKAIDLGYTEKKAISVKSHAECLKNDQIRNLIDKKFEIYSEGDTKCFLNGTSLSAGKQSWRVFYKPKKTRWI